MTLVVLGALGAAAFAAFPVIKNNQLISNSGSNVCAPNLWLGWPINIKNDGKFDSMMTKTIEQYSSNQVILRPGDNVNFKDDLNWDGLSRYEYIFQVPVSNFANCKGKDVRVVVLVNGKERGFSNLEIVVPHDQKTIEVPVRLNNHYYDTETLTYKSDFKDGNIKFQLRLGNVVLQESAEKKLVFDGFSTLTVSNCVNKIKLPTGKNQLVMTCDLKAKSSQSPNGGRLSITGMPIKATPQNLNMTNFTLKYVAPAPWGRTFTTETGTNGYNELLISPKLGAGWSNTAAGNVPNYIYVDNGATTKIEFYADTDIVDKSKPASVAFQFYGPEGMSFETSAERFTNTFPILTQNPILNVK